MLTHLILVALFLLHPLFAQAQITDEDVPQRTYFLVQTGESGEGREWKIGIRQPVKPFGIRTYIRATTNFGDRTVETPYRPALNRSGSPFLGVYREGDNGERITSLRWPETQTENGFHIYDNQYSQRTKGIQIEAGLFQVVSEVFNLTVAPGIAINQIQRNGYRRIQDREISNMALLDVSLDEADLVPLEELTGKTVWEFDPTWDLEMSFIVPGIKLLGERRLHFIAAKELTDSHSPYRLGISAR